MSPKSHLPDLNIRRLVSQIIDLVHQSFGACLASKLKSAILTKIVGEECTAIPEPIESLVLQCEELIASNRILTSEELTTFEATCDWAWERLNIGKYCDVDVNIRKLYAYSQLLKCLSLLVSQEIDVEALHCLDRALMVYACLGDGHLLSTTATRLHCILKQTILDDSIQNRLQDLLPSFPLKQLITTRIPFICKPDSYPIPKCRKLDLIEFEQKYLKVHKPVILSNAIDDWPCRSTRRWTLDYILNQCAFRLVPIELGSKYTDDSWSQKLMTVQQFVCDYIVDPKSQQTGYLAQHNLFDQIQDLADDYRIPDYCALPTQGDEDDCYDETSVEVNAWFGPSGTVSPLHTDPKDNLLVQVFGSKYIRLYSSETPDDQIYPHGSNLLNNTSRVNIEHVDRQAFPNFEAIDKSLIFECVLNEGEILYIPKKFWHFVKSLSTSFSLSFWWT